MSRKLHFFIVDDDEVSIELFSRLLTKEGHKVTAVNSSEKALEQIIRLQPDCVLCDLLLPGIDGYELFKKIRKIQDINQPSFIIITGKTYEFDRRHAYTLGVDGYFTKPINQETFVSDLVDIVNGTFDIQFWGVRGSFPVANKRSSHYGGNTNCVTLSILKKYVMIFDAGTGIKEYSNHVMEQNTPLLAKLFITHPHYDHINGLPFFKPLYIKGNEFEILGPDQSEQDLESVIAGQMDAVYFPVTINEFAAKVTFKSLTEESFYIDKVHFQTMYLNHPGKCLGYRVSYKGKSFCYVTDNEIFPEHSPNYNKFQTERLLDFISNADILIMDATYSDEEYKTKMGWGHSCVSEVVSIADKANVKLLCLHHHDPDESDKDIAAKLHEAKRLLKEKGSKVRCIVPHEGQRIKI